MTMKLIETNKRENCVFCCSESLIEEFSEKTPIFAGVTEDNENFFVEAVWGKCVDCETTQLLTLVPSEILYNDSHSPGTVGSMWDRHHREFKEFILKNIELNSFLEIGAGGGNSAIFLIKNNIVKNIIDTLTSFSSLTCNLEKSLMKVNSVNT